LTTTPTIPFETLGQEVLAGITTVHGGVSTGPFATLNTSFSVGDDPDAVKENRRVVAHALGIDQGSLVIPRLVHGTNVVVATASDAGSGAYDLESGVPATDALVTDVPGLSLAVLVADCAPVVLYDPRHRAIGIAHAGWRGAMLGVVSATAARMGTEYGSVPAELRVAVGPCIGWASLEMGSSEAISCQEAFPSRSDIVAEYDGRPHVNLRAMILAQLENHGVAPGQIEHIDTDTMEPGDYFSHRRARQAGFETSGRFMALVHVPR
jgi:YfiH family protein